MAPIQPLRVRPASVKTVLANRFWATNVRVSSPSMVAPFGSSNTERYEITPAFSDNEEKGVHYIPDRGTEWLLSAPRAHNAYINKVTSGSTGDRSR